jgi:branched-chain amino acid transport system permease protein
MSAAPAANWPHELMQSALDVIIPGIVVGCLYGLIGMAFAVTYRTTRVVNFALGEMMMVTAYVAFSIQARFSLGLVTFLPVTILAGAVIGLAVEYLVIRPMRSQPIFAIVMSTIGLAIVLRAITALVWGATAEPISMPVTTEYVDILGVNLSIPQILVVLLLLATCALSWFLFRFTRIGLLMRATASNESTAMLLGVDTGRMQSIAWMLSTVVAGLTGALLALIQSLGPSLYAIGFKGFPATVLGGLDAVIGSGIGGVLIGVVENITGRFYGAGAKEVTGLVIIVLVLMIRPNGLFGHRAVDRV